MKKWTPHRRDAALVRVERMTAGIATLGVLGAAALGYGLSTQAKDWSTADDATATSDDTSKDVAAPQPIDPQAQDVALDTGVSTSSSDDDNIAKAARQAAKALAAKKAAQAAAQAAAQQQAQQQAAQQQAQQQQQQAPQQSNNNGGGNKASSGGS